MESTELIKALSAALTFFSTLTVWLHNRNQGRKIRAELLKEFDEAIKEKSKHRSCELFRMLYGIHLRYKDIERLIENDDVSRIVHALSKNPGMVVYEKGEFNYAGLFKSTWMQDLNKRLGKSLNYVAISVIILSAFGMIISTGVMFVFSFLSLILFTILLADNFKQVANDEMIDDLINKKQR